MNTDLYVRKISAFIEHFVKKTQFCKRQIRQRTIELMCELPETL